MEKFGIGLKSTGNFLTDVKNAVEMANFLTFMKHCYHNPPYQLDSYEIQQGDSPDEAQFVLKIKRIGEDAAQA